MTNSRHNYFLFTRYDLYSYRFIVGVPININLHLDCVQEQELTPYPNLTNDITP